MASAMTFLIQGKDVSASKAVEGFRGELDRTSKHAKSFGEKFGTAIKVGTAAGAAALGAFAVSSVKAAAEDSQAQSVLANTLKKSAGARDSDVASVEDWISTTTLATGVADDELRPALGNLVRATKDTAKAQGLLKTAMDVSAATGKPLETVSLALAKAYNGNVGALGRLGINVKSTTKDTGGLITAQVAQKKAQLAYTEAVKAHGKHSAEAKKAALDLQLATSRVGLAQKKTKTTTVDFATAQKRLTDLFGGSQAAKTDTFAGQVQVLSNRFNETKETVGGYLLPILSSLMSWVTATAIPALQSFGGWVQRNSGWLKPLAAVIGLTTAAIWGVTAASKAWAAVQAAGGLLAYIKNLQAVQAMTKIWAGAQWLLNAAMAANPIGLVVVAIVALIAIFVLAYKKVGWFRAGVQASFRAIVAAGKWLWSGLKAVGSAIAGAFTWLSDKIRGAGDSIQNGWDHVIDFFKGLPGKIKGFFSGLADLLTLPFRTAFNAIADLWNNTLGKVSFTVPDWIPGVGGKGFSFPQIPHLAAGGIVTKPTLALIGEAGPEAVVPLSGRSGAGVNVYVDMRGSVGLDDRKVAATVRKALQGDRNRGVALGFA